jgi:GR25 family glycosyltransferase involved in LPS biosynthesis
MDIQIEVINLKQSTNRLKNIDTALTKEGLTYHRQEAVNGLDIKFYHRQTDRTFTGQELSENKVTLNTQLETYNKYIVTCDTTNVNPTHFVYNGFSINAGQVGALCSHITIWDRAVQNKQANTLILQDNFVPVDGFATKLDNLMNNLPETYDMVFLNVNKSAGELLAVEGNEYLKTFSSDAKWKGTAGIIISQKGMEKLLQDYEAPFNVPVDTYYYKYATCKNTVLACAILPKTFTEPMETYIAAETLIQNSGDQSITATMGDVKVIPDAF